MILVLFKSLVRRVGFPQVVRYIDFVRFVAVLVEIKLHFVKITRASRRVAVKVFFLGL